MSGHFRYSACLGCLKCDATLVAAHPDAEHVNLLNMERSYSGTPILEVPHSTARS